MGWPELSARMDPDNPLSASDYHQTPHIDQMASDGVVFTNGYTSGPIRSPGRAGIMTGQNPAQVNVTYLRQAAFTSHSNFKNYFTGRPLVAPQPSNTLPNETTIAQVVKQANSQYQTGFFGKYDWWPRADQTGFDEHSILYFQDFNPEDPGKVNAITDDSIAFIEDKAAAGQPFFITVAHEVVKLNKATTESLEAWEGTTPGERHYDTTYAATHTDLDNSVGAIMDKLAELEIDDNTYVIFTSDHGAGTGVPGTVTANLPLYGGKGSLYEGGIRVPFIVKGPNVASGVYSDAPVIGTDIFATAYAMAGGVEPLGNKIEGANLLGVLATGSLPSNEKISRSNAENGELFFHYPNYGTTLDAGPATPASAVIDDGYKLISIYGENGEDNSFRLFNLSETLEENFESGSPLNLASAMPQKVAELDQKLTVWLESQDASLPYDVRDPVSIEWSAEHRMTEPTTVGVTADKDAWRSVTNVDSRERESWLWTVSSSPRQEATNAFQQGLPDVAAVFDDQTRAFRRYFHAGDDDGGRVIDSDHSATFEMWVRVDELTGEQVLFEAGTDGQGLSITLGDADNDGQGDDLRFRILSDVGEALTSTVELDRFANPTRDFVHIVGVVDDTSDRGIELFVNGVSRGYVAAGGASPLDWDTYDYAGLGGESHTNSLGASGGAGDLPFSGGNLKGQIASFSFHNFDLSAEQVLASYSSALDPVHQGVASVSGDARRLLSRPASLASGDAETGDQLWVIEERADTLDESLAVDRLADSGAAGLLAAGTAYTSYLLHFDPLGSSAPDETVFGSVTFVGDILGVIFNSDSLATTDTIVGSAGLFEEGDRSLNLFGQDGFGIGTDGKTLSFLLSAGGDDLVQLRVITTATLSGDFNGDGAVDAADFTVWRDGLGVDFSESDYDVWVNNFGRTLASQAPASLQVPEPSAIATVAVALLALRGRRSRVSLGRVA
ncbi:Choline-sulfatase [Pseudobythopirellula maris]|uniref:Choline-sulfatase n=2 Tax=Pseudobythopirellula maris TaxID=2527991 RepID=A0A5C5ZSY7_9BACT|nr:Choline-sulfatase [Pseudobythopirellula maris]